MGRLRGCAICSSTSTRLAESLVAVLGGGALGREALGLAGLLEHPAPLGEGRLGLGPALEGAREGVAIAASWASASSPCSSACADRATSASATFRRPGFLSPLVVRPWSARSSLRLARLVPRSPPLMRRLQAVAQGALVMAEVGELVVADRRGRAEEGLGRDARQLGEDLVGEGRVRDRLAVVVEPDRAARAGEGLLELAGLRAVLVVLLEVDGDRRTAPSSAASHGRSASRSPAELVTRRVMASSMARWIVDLPASFGPRTTVRPGARSTARWR